MSAPPLHYGPTGSANPDYLRACREDEADEDATTFTLHRGATDNEMDSAGNSREAA